MDFTSARISVFVGKAGGDLYDALETKLKFSAKLTEEESTDSVGSLGEGDIAVFGAGYFTTMNATNGSAIQFQRSIEGNAPNFSELTKLLIIFDE